MRINEILIESQLNEEVLTELDWSKIKKGLATGAITLGALGVSGNAMAQHFKVDNASKIKDSQVVKYVQDKVDTGEIKPAVVKQAVQKVDAAPEVKKDEPKKAAPEVKKVEEPKNIDVVNPFKYNDGATYSTIAVKSDKENPNIKIYLGKRDGKSGISYAIYAVDLTAGKGVNIKSGFRTDSDDLSTAQTQFAKDVPLAGTYELTPGSSQYKRYELLKDKFSSEIKKDEPKKELSKDNKSNIVEMAKMAPYKVARLIKRSAFDGDSLKFDDWRMKSVSDKSGDGWLIITGSVNGKNKFGAYVGFKQFLATIDPDTGEVQKLYMENDPKYIQALALISTFKTNLSTPVHGPSAGKWGLF